MQSSSSWHALFSAFVIVFKIRATLADNKWSRAEVTSSKGHYPHIACVITDVVLHAYNATFLYSNSKSATDHGCKQTGDLWPLQQISDQSAVKPTCSKTYDLAFTFPMYYFGTGSNYYHLHYDTVFPGFKHLQAVPPDIRIAMMPMVESSRLKMMAWETKAFKNPDKYWMSLMQFMSSDVDLLPLHNELLDSGENICFKKIHFGLNSWKSMSDKSHSVVSSYRDDAWRKLGISGNMPIAQRVGIISRNNRRRILNEKELVASVRHIVPAELVHFEGMSFVEQVECVQNYTVLVGINGAGLMNCIYLPRHSTCIQMTPYKASVNTHQYGLVLKSRGPYLEWENTHENMTRVQPSDKNLTHPDTIVHVQEFIDLIIKALKLSDASMKQNKDEL